MSPDLCEHGKDWVIDGCDQCSIAGLKSQLKLVLEERNEARSRLEEAEKNFTTWHNAHDSQREMNEELHERLEFRRIACERLEAERDEARSRLDSGRRIAQHWADQHSACAIEILSTLVERQTTYDDATIKARDRTP